MNTTSTYNKFNAARADLTIELLYYSFDEVILKSIESNQILMYLRLNGVFGEGLKEA